MLALVEVIQLTWTAAVPRPKKYETLAIIAFVVAKKTGAIAPAK